MEKLCKAFLCHGQSNPSDLQGSHGYAQKQIPRIVQHYAEISGVDAAVLPGLMPSINQLARKIDLLHPQVDDGGTRQDNCEYPWETVGPQVVAPCDYGFPNLSSLYANRRLRIVFEKVIARAVEDLASG